MPSHPNRLSFKGASGADLAARLDLPAGKPKAYAIFAHCFTCSKDIIAARTISTALTASGIAVLRFDFTGLGHSDGEFASTNFSMNLADLKSAADFMRENYEAPQLLIGHSLGGAAVIAVARDIPEVKAVATIGAPAHVGHIKNQFADHIDDIQKTGAADVELAGRPFRIQKQFLDDLEQHTLLECVSELHTALLILHAPLDNTVGIENASELFQAAKHPKSFISLDDADHLVTDKEDAAYAAQVIAAWSSRYLHLPEPVSAPASDEYVVLVSETGEGKYQNLVETGPHHLIVDEPTNVGGLGSGPTPYDLLCAALGACTTMTIRMYADRKDIPLTHVSCEVDHRKSHQKDAQVVTSETEMKPDVFTRRIAIKGDLEEAVRDRIFEIAGRCPVHRTLETGATVLTERREG